jgi:hypothetical protein
VLLTGDCDACLIDVCQASAVGKVMLLLLKGALLLPPCKALCDVITALLRMEPWQTSAGGNVILFPLCGAGETRLNREELFVDVRLLLPPSGNVVMLPCNELLTPLPLKLIGAMFPEKAL